jgi:hypothetical protein
MMRDIVLGVEKPEIFRSLSVEYGVSYHAIYTDYKRRDTWQSDILDIKDSRTLALDLVALLNWLKRRGVLEVLSADNSNARIGAIRTVADIATRIYTILKETGLIDKLPDELKEELNVNVVIRHLTREDLDANSDGNASP